MNEDEYRAEDLRLKRVEIISNFCLTIAIAYFALQTFIKENTDWLSVSLAQLTFIVITVFIIIAFILNRPIKKKSNNIKKDKWNARMWIFFSAISGALASKAFDQLATVSILSIAFWFLCIYYAFIFIVAAIIFERIYGKPS